jgi:hypothetical protein
MRKNFAKLSEPCRKSITDMIRSKGKGKS